jgi:UDP-N-acetylglucosamine diphosphorylase/glucosamine-1-phosphate N-acetyltransferase
MEKEIVLFEDEGFVDLLPMVFWRSVFELRYGRRILLDRMAQELGAPVAGVWTRAWLAPVAAQRCGAPSNQPASDTTVLVNGRWLFDGPVDFPRSPSVGVVGSDVAYIVCDARLAGCLKPATLLDAERLATELTDVERVNAPGRFLRYPWDIIADLKALLEGDWREADACCESALPTGLVLAQPDRVHIGEHTVIHPTAVIDAAEGPVFISHDVRVGPFSVIEGPAYIGPGTRIFPHTSMRGGNAIGPVCRIGGELNGCVIHGYSNKQHFGFLGHSYVGSWVNIGAGATNSNLKNTYGKIRVPVNGMRVDTGLTFFGAIIADHVKIGINASIPTGAVIGLGASISGTSVLPTYIPSFGWGTDEGVRTGDPLRLLDVATAAMARRDVDMTDEEVELFLDLGKRVRSFEATARSTSGPR